MTTYYTVSAVPAAHSFGSSAYIRTEYTLIQTAFATVNTEMASKAPLESPTFTGTAVLPGTTSIGNVSDTEIAYLDGVTSSIQTQLNSLNTSKGVIAGQAWTGSHDFTGATTTVATQAASDATDKAASTAMVQAALTAYAGTNLGLPTYTIADALSVVRLNSLATDYEWTGLKTVNGESIMGSGNIAIPPSNVQTFTATGTLTDGMKVGLRSDGTVEPVVQTVVSTGTGATATAHSANDTMVRACYDSTNQRVVVVYKSASDTFGYAVVGTVSGSSISFGTPVAFTAAAVAATACTFDSANGKVVVAYYSGGGKVIVGTVSGSSISFGTAVACGNMSGTNDIDMCFNVATGKVLVAYPNGSQYITGIVGTVSGTTISFGAAAVLNANASNSVTVCSDTASSSIVVAYYDTAAAYVNAAAGTISGTTLTWGAVATTSLNMSFPRIVSAGSGRVVFACVYAGATQIYYTVGFVSGSTLILAPSVATNASSPLTTQAPAITYDPLSGKVLIANIKLSTSQPNYAVYTISGGSLVPDAAEAVMEAVAYTDMFACYDSVTGQSVLAFNSAGTTLKARTLVAGYTSTNANNFIGISKSAVTNAAAQIATLGAKVTNQTGLTPGAVYYLTDTGTLSTTPNNRKIGKATAATDLIIDTDDVSSGAWVLLSTVTAAGPATVDIEQTFSDAFDEYVITCSGVKTSAAANILGRVKVAGAYVTSSSYKYGFETTTSWSTAQWAGGNSDTNSYGQMTIFPCGVSTGDVSHITINVSTPASTRYPVLGWFGRAQRSADAVHGTGAGVCAIAGPMTGLRLYPSSGVILSGTFRLYGIKK